MKLPISRVAAVLSTTCKLDREELAEGYSIDSRTLRPGELFFAVKGERLDGHDFVQAALKAGAVAAVVQREEAARYADPNRLLVVDDTLAAMQTLGAAVRRLWGKPVVGVTGSAGKTTTKEIIAHLLGTRFRVFKSEGNLNNHFGLPLMLLRLESVHDIAVIEMGMSHPGEIRELARIAAPDIGVVTCVAPVHLEFFKSVLDIAKAKYELIEALPKAGTAVLNADDVHVAKFGRDFGGAVLTFGIRNDATVRAERVQLRGAEGSQFDIITQERRQTVTLPLVGSHNIYNALAGAAVALDRGIDLSKIVSSMADLAPVDKRGEVIELAGATVINDCYNSNPKALEAMVEALLTIPAKRRIVVAGEMLELGPDGPELHRECGDRMAERKIDFLLGVRGAARYMVDAALHAGMRAEFVESPKEAGEWLAQNVRSGDAILLKASRGVRLEMALESWRSRLPGRAGDIGGKALGRSR